MVVVIVFALDLIKNEHFFKVTVDFRSIKTLKTSKIKNL